MNSQPFAVPVAPLVQSFDSADVVPSGVSSGSCPCWRRRCTATAPPSGARTTWQESREARFQYTQVAHTPRAPASSVQSGLSLCPPLPSHQCTPGGQTSVLQHQPAVGGCVHLRQRQSCSESRLPAGAEPRYERHTCADSPRFGRLYLSAPKLSDSKQTTY